MMLKSDPLGVWLMLNQSIDFAGYGNIGKTYIIQWHYQQVVLAVTTWNSISRHTSTYVNIYIYTYCLLDIVGGYIKYDPDHFVFRTRTSYLNQFGSPQIPNRMARHPSSATLWLLLRSCSNCHGLEHWICHLANGNQMGIVRHKFLEEKSNNLLILNLCWNQLVTFKFMYHLQSTWRNFH